MSNNTDTTKQKHKIETSKKLLAAVLIVCFSMIGACIYSWMFLGKEEITSIITVLMVPISTVVACYTIKARSENILKIKLTAKECGLDMNEEIQEMEKDLKEDADIVDSNLDNTLRSN